MPGGTRGFTQAIETAAGREQLWGWLLEPALLRRWLALAAVVDAREGGRYQIDSALFGRREAHIERLDPGLRLTLMYHDSPGWPLPPGGALVEEFFVDDRGARRILRIMASGIPRSVDWVRLHRRLQAGWTVALSRLQRQLSAEAASS